MLFLPRDNPSKGGPDARPTERQATRGWIVSGAVAAGHEPVPAPQGAGDAAWRRLPPAVDAADAGRVRGPDGVGPGPRAHGPLRLRPLVPGEDVPRPPPARG